jgi:hypothetical protein
VALIEGIGSITGLLYPLLPIGPGPQDPFVNTLTCVTIDNQPVYPDTTASCPFVSGINQQEEFSSFSIYPNPVSEGATIIFPSAPKGSVAEVLDYKGQLIESLLFKNGSANWNTCHVSKGFYVIRVQKPDGSSYAKKVVVK